MSSNSIFHNFPIQPWIKFPPVDQPISIIKIQTIQIVFPSLPSPLFLKTTTIITFTPCKINVGQLINNAIEKKGEFMEIKEMRFYWQSPYYCVMVYACVDVWEQDTPIPTTPDMVSNSNFILCRLGY